MPGATTVKNNKNTAQRVTVVCWLVFVWSLPASLFGMQVALCLGTLILLGQLIVTRFRTFYPSPLDRPVGMMILAISLSLLLAPHGISSLQTATSFWVVIAFYFTWFSLDRQSTLVKALIGFFSLSAIAVIFGLYQSLSHSYPWGELIHPGSSNLLKPIYGLPDKVAALGFFSSRLTFAHVLVFSFLLASGLLLEKGLVKHVRVLLATLVFLMGVGLYFTYTRAGLVVAVFLFFVMFVVTHRHDRRLWVVSAFTILILGVAFSLVAPKVYQRISTSFSGTRDWNRLIVWQVALDMASEYPFSGIGYGNFQWLSEERIDQRVKAIGAKRFTGVRAYCHNNLLSFLAQAGVVGAFAFCFLFFVYFREARKALLALPDDAPFLLGFVRGSIAAVAGFLMVGLVHDTFFDGEVALTLWFCMGASLTASRLAKAKRPRDVVLST